MVVVVTHTHTHHTLPSPFPYLCIYLPHYTCCILSMEKEEKWRILYDGGALLSLASLLLPFAFACLQDVIYTLRAYSHLMAFGACYVFLLLP